MAELRRQGYEPSPKGGRPPRWEMRRREQQLLRLIADGSTLADASSDVGMNAATVVRLLDRPDFHQAYVALRAAA